MTLKTTFITLNNGTQICAPSDINLMTNFILKEQGDWFEDEIHFVRKFIQPGMTALDIGANYGLYSTAIASNLGENGKLWCFEPTQDTADALRKTISKNNLDNNIELIQSGLSDHIGQASFFTSPNAELNSLTQTDYTDGEKQTIELLTLDYCYEKYQWENLDFIKLDAEGEELNILKEAKKTLSNCSPLIMFELKHGKEINMPLITAFKNLGYSSFYLIPSLNILCPLDLSKPLDGFQLNLFCCKEETALKLAKNGFLVQTPKPLENINQSPGSDFFTQLPFAKDYTILSSASNDQGTQDNSSNRSRTELYQSTFNAYANSRNTTLSLQDQLQYLSSAFEGVKKILKQGESKIGRLTTLARISYDIGHRGVGNQVLGHIIQEFIHKHKPIVIDEELVPASLEFETIPTNKQMANWLCASVVDQFINKHAYSCYFTGEAATHPHFELLGKINFLTPKMAQRLKVIQLKEKQEKH